MVAPVILPVVFTALSTSVATGVGYLSLKWRELNRQVQTLVEQQKLKAVETTREAAGDLLAPLKQWLRPIGGWAARAFLVNTALSVVAIASTSLLGYLCLAEVRALRNELRSTNASLNGIKGEDVFEGNAFDNKIRANNKTCSKSNDTASTGEDVAEDSWFHGGLIMYPSPALAGFLRMNHAALEYEVLESVREHHITRKGCLPPVFTKIAEALTSTSLDGRTTRRFTV